MTPSFSTKRAACLHCDFRHKDIFNFQLFHFHDVFHFFRCYYIITKKILSRHFTLRHYMLHHFVLRHCIYFSYSATKTLATSLFTKLTDNTVWKNLQSCEKQILQKLYFSQQFFWNNKWNIFSHSVLSNNFWTLYHISHDM